MDSPNVLIVDDSSIIRRLLSKQLEESGARVAQAQDGIQGLEKALSEKFDLIISDVEMPRMDGFALCEALKNSPDTQKVPVIILSSLDGDKDIEQGFRAGADAYVSKSEAREVLLETVQRVIEKSTFHHSRRILLVDDSATIRSLAKKALETAGFQTLTAEDGYQALELVKSHPPDLILSDVDMPGMNGIALCKAIHGDPDLAVIPFVIMSANSDRAVMRRMLQWGASAYLVKPFNLEQMVIIVEKLLSDHFLLLLKERERLDSERKLMIASITSLIEALEARDPYTRGHSEAVAMLVSNMAFHMGFSSEEIESLNMACRLHDLGKIGVPDSILLKAGPLTDDEFAAIKQHPVIGATILGPIPSIHPLLPVILHHHERFDGKGYPHGLKGEKIPQWARLTAVADTYHALTSDRPYRKGMSRERAFQIISDVKGTQLCPECVDVFLDWIRSVPEEAGTLRYGVTVQR